MTETQNVDLSERDVMRRLIVQKFMLKPLEEQAASYMKDALRMMDNPALEKYLRLYARIAFRLARRSLGEVDCLNA